MLKALEQRREKPGKERTEVVDATERAKAQLGGKVEPSQGNNGLTW